MLGSDSHHCAINGIIMSFWLADYGLGGEEEEEEGGGSLKGGEGEKRGREMAQTRVN